MGEKEKYRVLYVDDDRDIREIAELSLGLQDNFEVASCDSGPQALEISETWGPHLILLDVMMPRMDGPTTLLALRNNSKTAHIPVVFVTARTQNADIAKFIELGARGVISKPFDPMDFAARALSYLN